MKKYDVAAYIWPAYSREEIAKIFWPMGIGEWETVMKNKPKFEGHEQPRYPLWGYVNEADPYVMEMQIEAAYDHGVNVFIYDWYWYDRRPYLEGCLNNGYLKARNNNKVKFYLMWANHDVNLGWDKRNADDAFTNQNSPILWNGGVDSAEFKKICRRLIDNYFSQPSYYKIDGKPVFMLYDLDVLVTGFGGLKETKEAFDWFREEVVKAGFEGLELQTTMRSLRDYNATCVAGDSIGTPREVIDAIGFNSLTHYQFCHFANVKNDYNNIVSEALTEWNKIISDYDIPYYPHVSVGWDTNPRANVLIEHITTNNTPQNFEKALLLAKEFSDKHNKTPLITINSWNEWTETSYLQPCTKYGYGYLEAVKKVFGGGNV